MRLQVCQLSMDVIQKYSNTLTASLKSLFLLLIGRKHLNFYQCK